MERLGLETSLRDLAFILFKRFRAFAAIVAMGLAITFVWLFLLRDDAYLVGAKVLIKLGQEQSLPPTALGERPMIVGQRTQDVNSEADILQSAELVAKVVDHLGLDKPDSTPPPERLIKRIRYEIKRGIGWVKDGVDRVMIAIGLREELSPREKAILALQMGIEVKPQKDSNVLVAVLTYPARVGPAFILNTLLDFYLESRSKIFQDSTAVGFFEQQVAASQETLRAAEEAQRRFEGDSSISTIERQKDVLLERIAAAEAPLDATRIERAEASAKVERFERELRQPDPDLAAIGEFGVQSFPDEILQQLAVLQREREKLRMLELDESVPIQNNRAQFAVLAGMLGSHLRAVRAEAQAEYDARGITAKKLRGELAALQDKSSGLAGLKRDVSVAERNYLFYQQKLEEAHAAAALDRSHVGNAVVIERATDPVAPTGLRKTTLLGICLGVTLLVALAWISLLEFFDQRIYSAEELERQLGAPVLAVVPTEKRPRAA